MPPHSPVLTTAGLTATTGALKGVPHQQAYRGELDRKRWPLVSVAQLGELQGTDLRNVRCVRSAVARVPRRDGLVHRCDLRSARRRSRRCCRACTSGLSRATGRFAAENFCGDSYHGPWSHGSAMSAGFSAQTAASRGHRAISFVSGQRPLRDGAATGRLRRTPAEVVAYEKEVRAEVRARLGPRIDVVRPVVGTVFPTWRSFAARPIPSACGTRVAPKAPKSGPGSLLTRHAPASLKEAVRLAGLRSFGPAGTFEQDDIDNWRECTQSGARHRFTATRC